MRTTAAGRVSSRSSGLVSRFDRGMTRDVPASASRLVERSARRSPRASAGRSAQVTQAAEERGGRQRERRRSARRSAFSRPRRAPRSRAVGSSGSLGRRSRPDERPSWRHRARSWKLAPRGPLLCDGAHGEAQREHEPEGKRATNCPCGAFTSQPFEELGLSCWFSRARGQSPCQDGARGCTLPASANCYKARLLLAQLGLAYERLQLDIFAGESTTAAYREKNPAGRTPVLARPGADDRRVECDPPLPRRARRSSPRSLSSGRASGSGSSSSRISSSRTSGPPASGA